MKILISGVIYGFFLVLNHPKLPVTGLDELLTFNLQHGFSIPGREDKDRTAQIIFSLNEIKYQYLNAIVIQHAHGHDHPTLQADILHVHSAICYVSQWLKPVDYSKASFTLMEGE